MLESMYACIGSAVSKLGYSVIDYHKVVDVFLHEGRRMDWVYPGGNKCVMVRVGVRVALPWEASTSSSLALDPQTFG